MYRTTTVRVVLEGELAKKFLELKKHLGLKNNAEVLRHCISICHTSIFGDRKVMKQSGPIHDTVDSASLAQDKGRFN